MGFLKVIRKWALRDKMPIREIARRTGISRNTIKKYLREGIVEPAFQTPDRPSKLDPYAKQLTAWLVSDQRKSRKERRTAKLMHADLVKLGYDGSYERVAAFVREWKGERQRAHHTTDRGTFVPLVFAPGEAFQFDWSEDWAYVGGERIKLQVAHIKLSHSRAFLVRAYLLQTHEMLFDAHWHAFRVFEGVPGRGIYDNMKTAVDKVGIGKKRDVNARFTAMTSHYVFDPEFCNPAAGWEKGQVEKNVRDARHRMWQLMPAFPDLDALNAWLEERCKLLWAETAHGTLPGSIADVWEAEKPALMLSRLSRWHVESEAMARALAMVIEGQSALPMARFWGAGQTASSDGQFFPTTRQGEAMNVINARYGHEPGLKAYTHVSDQFSPFATQTIPATVNEAPYILDGLLMTDAGQKIREQYADTGGFTDHVFAVTALLGFQFIPRIRDLPSKRLYLFDPAACPKELKGLIGGKIRQSLIASNWPDILRSVATMASGAMSPSQLLRKFASYPRQHELAVTLREIGRVERTLFIIDWLLDADMQRRAQVGLNKGEAHHALKNALRIGRQGEIRDRTSEGQHFRMAGLNLLAAIVIYWNTKHLGQAVTSRRREGLDCLPNLLAHISPLGWAHILLTGEYRWPKRA
ncbi:MAG: IS21 family transposase [Paracoccus sp.]|nr:IS21 family transposase [Paracoccus sp. (in: a-proteobacteria)]